MRNMKESAMAGGMGELLGRGTHTYQTLPFNLLDTMNVFARNRYVFA